MPREHIESNLVHLAEKSPHIHLTTATNNNNPTMPCVTVTIPQCPVSLSQSHNALCHCHNPTMPCVTATIPQCPVSLSQSHNALCHCHNPTMPCVTATIPQCPVSLPQSHNDLCHCHNPTMPCVIAYQSGDVSDRRAGANGTTSFLQQSVDGSSEDEDSVRDLRVQRVI